MTDLEQLAIQRLQTASEMSLHNYGLPPDDPGKDGA